MKPKILKFGKITENKGNILFSEFDVDCCHSSMPVPLVILNLVIDRLIEERQKILDAYLIQ